MSDVNDTSGIDSEESYLGPAYAVKQLINLDWNVNGSAHYGQPLGPAPLTPETKRLDQPQRSIGKGSASKQPKSDVVGLGGSLDKDPWKATGWVKVKVMNEFFGHALRIRVDESEQAEAS